MNLKENDFSSWGEIGMGYYAKTPQSTPHLRVLRNEQNIRKRKTAADLRDTRFSGEHYLTEVHKTENIRWINHVAATSINAVWFGLEVLSDLMGKKGSITWITSDLDLRNTKDSEALQTTARRNVDRIVHWGKDPRTRDFASKISLVALGTNSLRDAIEIAYRGFGPSKGPRCILLALGSFGPRLFKPQNAEVIFTKYGTLFKETIPQIT